MNCVELQKSLAENEDGSGAEQQAHLRRCSDCSTLVAELNLIASSASALREAEEPSPRVWNSIEIALREEKLIRPLDSGRSLIPSLSSRWGWARWLAPAAALLLIAVGLYFRQHSISNQLARDAAKSAVHQPALDAELAGLNDDDLRQEVAGQSPAVRAQYEDNLRQVNQYIEDAKNDVAANPNNEESRRALMEAYQQKGMLFELAMDHPLQ